MTLMDYINALLTGALFVGFFSGALFMVIYTRIWDWWTDEHGAHLGYFTLSLTLIMGLYVLRPFIPQTVFAYLRAPFFLAVIACMVWRLVLLLKTQRHKKRSESSVTPVNDLNK